MRFKVGQWILWTTTGQVKQGEIVRLSGPSMVVRWLDGSEQVFPIYEQYIGARRSRDHRMDVIERPREASRIARDRKRGVQSVALAAASLGTTPKRIRAMLRAGQLKGEQVDGKWVSVDLEA